LRLIDKYPARRAPDLAASQRRDPMIFKRDVRKLKDLGLTEALEIGYRLSPRGRVVLNAINTTAAANNNTGTVTGSNHHHG
jgi:ribosomal protein S19E (S16A)